MKRLSDGAAVVEVLAVTGGVRMNPAFTRSEQLEDEQKHLPLRLGSLLHVLQGLVNAELEICYLKRIVLGVSNRGLRYAFTLETGDLLDQSSQYRRLDSEVFLAPSFRIIQSIFLLPNDVQSILDIATFNAFARTAPGRA